MILRTVHTHTDNLGAPLGHVLIDIDTTGEVRDTHAQQHQRSMWRAIREAFFETPEGVPYLYFDGRRTHQVMTIAELAAVTRRERMGWGVVWREDPKAVV